MFPLGILLNNSGNIERTDDVWRGQARLQDHKRFVRFLTPEAGLRAMMKILIRYEDIYKLNSISKMISRWAPPEENDTHSYIMHVSHVAGYPPNKFLDMDDPEVLIRIAQAITIHENGHSPDYMPVYWYDDDTYKRAAMAALELDE